MTSRYDASSTSLAGMSIQQVRSLCQDPNIQAQLDQYDSNDTLPAHLVQPLEAALNRFGPPLPNSSVSSSTKRKNASKRNPDIDFATEIGQGLLVEVRKLQNTIQEKDEIIKHLDSARMENEQRYDASQRYMRQRDEAEERLKEENWNLEVANQELRTHVTESNQIIAKYNSEQIRLTKQAKTQSEQIDIMKAQEEKNTSLIEAMKARHEQETHQLRKHAANAQRENAQTQKQVEAINTELKICKAKLAIKMAAQSSVPAPRVEDPVEETQVETEIVREPASAPTAQRSQSMETETLKQSLAHAHRIISNLRTSAHKEKLEKFELKKMLSDSQEQVEQLSKDLANAALSRAPKMVNTKKKPAKKRRVNGVARQARGVSSTVSSASDQKSDSEDSVDSMEEDLMDPQFEGLGMGFGTPISAPLSSELEFKVQVMDTGMNTDIDLDSFVQKQVKDELELVSVRAAALLLPQQMEILVQNQVFTPKHMHQPPRERVQQITLSKSDVEKQIIHALETKTLRSVQPEMILWITQTLDFSANNMTQEVADQHIAQALQKQTAFASSQPLFTQAEVDHFIAEALEKSASTSVSTVDTPVLEKSIHTASRTLQLPQENTLEAIAPQPRTDVPLAESGKKQKTQDTLAQEQTHNPNVKALENPKAELAQADKSVAEHKESTIHREMVTREQADTMVANALEELKEAFERQSSDTISKDQSDALVAQALEKQKSGLISQSEVNQLIATAVSKQKAQFEGYVPKTDVDQLVTAAVNEQKAQLESYIPKADVDRLISTAVNEQKVQFENYIPKADVAQLISDALNKQHSVASKTQIVRPVVDTVEKQEDTVPKSKVDLLISEAIEKHKNQTSSSDTIAKSQVDILIAEALEKQRNDLVPAKDMVSRSRVDKMIAEALEKQTAQLEDTVPKAQVQTLINEALEKQKVLLEDTVPKSQVNALIADALDKQSREVTSSNQDNIPKSQVDILISEALKKQKADLNDMVPKSQVDFLICEALEKQKAETHTTEILVSQTHVLLTEVPEKQKVSRALSSPPKALKEHESLPQTAYLEEIVSTENDTVTKSEMERLIDEATKKGIAIGEQRSKNEEIQSEPIEKEIASHEQPMLVDMVARSDVDVIVAEAVALEKEQVTLNMISKAQAEKLTTDALEEARLEWQKTEKEMLSQSQVDSMIEQAKERLRADFHAKFEKAEQEAKLNTMTKAQAEAMALEAVEKERLIMVSAEQAQAMVTEAIEKENEKTLERHQQALDQILLETNEEKLSLSKRIESYKKDCEDMNHRMKDMLTRESSDILVKRAVADALQTTEKRQKEALANMVSKAETEILIKQAVSRSLEQERKEAAEREEAEAMLMISKAEAEALAKAAAADATVKERQIQAAREKELVSKEEADALAQQAVREAVEKEKIIHADTLAKERKSMKEKEENMITKEQAESMSTEAVRIALDKERATYNSRSLNSQGMPIPERSNSTSKVFPTSNDSGSPPSFTMPSARRNRLRLSSSVSSLRRNISIEKSISKSDNNNNKPSIDNTRAYGTLRILDSGTYGSHIVGSKNSLRNFNNQESATSVSSISSDDARQNPSAISRTEETLSGFSNVDDKTNMDVIFAITQTMIGGWMLKHTRRYVGGGISENKHRRFFWVHPYTKTLYWSSIEPGVDGGESRAKSAFIESVIVVTSHNQAEASPMSLLIRTPRRDIKMTAPNLEKHEMWLKSLQHILKRTNQAQQSSDEAPNEENQYNNTMQSIKSMIPIHDPNHYDSDDSEDIVNIRQCCDGKHDVSALSKKHTHSPS